MIQFITDNYKLLVACLSLLITLIIFIINLIKSCKNKKYTDLLKYIPIIICEAEDVFKLVSNSGNSKLSYVLNKVRAICSELNINYNTEKYKEIIEGYLSTPQKNK